MKQIKTGIAGLDYFLHGGLPPKVLLLSGVPGSGNEIFARQIAYEQAKQRKVAYFTVHSTADYVTEDMMAYGWDITQLVDDGNWKFLNINGDKPFVDTVIAEMKQHRTVVIDSLSELLLTHKTEDVISLLTAMTRQNSDREEFQLLLLTEGMQTPQAETMMEHFSEGVIVFNTAWNADSTLRHILIKKMRGTTVPIRSLQYNITKKGFIIETATRIN
ncbi:MAG: RAD55 family ATPase [Candidatus Bathyarchaeia archaeon]|jgi:KaiC/GvpD/RAD55 family RecA-like ATPase